MVIQAWVTKQPFCVLPTCAMGYSYSGSRRGRMSPIGAQWRVGGAFQGGVGMMPAKGKTEKNI